MLLAVLWIYFVCYLHLGHGLSHHIRHERTRYMSGRNQIYASGLSPKFDFTENYIPFVQFWERPLQVLESSMGVPKRLSSRPLFSWDIPVQMSTYTPTKKQSTSENPTSTTTETSTWSFSKESKPPDSNEVSSVTYLPKSVQQVRSDRLNRAKDSVTYRTSYVYNSTPTKKKKSINRKKSIEGFLQSNNLKWKETNDQSLNSVKYANESSVKSLNHKKDSKKKKKKGKKSKKGKSVNGKRSKIAAMVEKLKKGVYEEMNDFSPALTVNKAEYLDKHSPINVLKPKQRMMSLEQKKIDIPEVPRISACEIMEDKCEHKCRDENGTAVCTCFQGFTPVGTKCIDIDECLTDNGGCNGRCINTIGSRKCYCYPGFRLIDGACADINECLLRNGHGPCQDRCTNTLGSYYCSCEGLPGTTLSSDNHTCEDSNVCNSGTDGCSHSCISISGRTFCTCPDGMELGADWKTCHDIDECSNPEDYNVECEYGCINTIGSYACADQTTATVDIST